MFFTSCSFHCQHSSKTPGGGSCAVVAFYEQHIINILFYATEMVYIRFHNFYNCDVSQKYFICE